MDIAAVVDLKKNPNIPNLLPGDTVRVHVKVVEGERERIQVFQGVVIKIKNGTTGNFTVRRVAYNTGIERTFPFNSPFIDKVEVTRHGKVRRARLFYLRGLTTKKARLKEKRIIIKQEVTEQATVDTPEATPATPVPESAIVTPAPEAVTTEAIAETEKVTPPTAEPEAPKAEASNDETAQPETEAK